MMGNIFLCVVCHVYVLFGDMSLLAFCLFLNCIALLLLSYSWVLKIFIYSWYLSFIWCVVCKQLLSGYGLFLHLLTGSLAEQFLTHFYVIFSLSFALMYILILFGPTSFTRELPRKCCLVFKYLRFFSLSAIGLFEFDSAVVREHTLSDFNSFKNFDVCFVPDDGLSWYMPPGHWRRIQPAVVGRNSG